MSAAPDYNAETLATFDRAAARYAEKYFGLRDYDADYAAWVDALPPHAGAVLDLACGPGNVAAFVRARRPDVALHCADGSAAMLAQVQQRVPGARTWPVDARDLSALPTGLDGAAFCFGLSYFDDADAARVLAELHRVLAPGAPLLLATVAGDPAHSGAQTSASGDRVINFFRTAVQVAACIQGAGFAVQTLREVPSPATASLRSLDVVVLARRI